MKWLARNWVFVFSILVLFLNVEFVVMPFLVFATGIRGDPFFRIAAFCATAELFYWYFVPLERFREIIVSKAALAVQRPTVAGIIEEFYKRGLAASLIMLVRLVKDTVSDIAGFVAVHVLKITEVNDMDNGKKFRLIMFAAKWGGYAMLYSLMFLLGLGPFGLWIAGLAYSRSRRSFTGILFVAAGNILKTYFWSIAVLHFAP